MPMAEFGGYVLAQIAGALLGSLVVFLIASGKAGYVLATDGLGQNGFGAGYLGEYSMGAALIFELIATFVFVSVILAATASHVSSASTALAGLAIGLTLTGIHLVGINVTGVSVNPARSLAPALFVGGKALSDLWVFIVAPLAGGAAAGLAHASGFFRPGGIEPAPATGAATL